MTHLYQPDHAARVLTESQRPCLSCPLPKANKVHKLKPNTPEARAWDAAILGEHEREEDDL